MVRGGPSRTAVSAALLSGWFGRVLRVNSSTTEKSRPTALPSLSTRLAAELAVGENQVAAAVKLLPLGQTAGQRVLGELLDGIPAAIQRARGVEDARLGASEPGLAIASALHETQYSRLFRS